MINRSIAWVLVILVSVFTTGCATSMGQNIVGGAALGGVLGGIVGDSSDAARKGVGIGALLGALIPAPQQYGYPQANYGAPPPVYGGHRPPLPCPGGSYWDGRGCRVEYPGYGAPIVIPQQNYGAPHRQPRCMGWRQGPQGWYCAGGYMVMKGEDTSEPFDGPGEELLDQWVKINGLDLDS